MVGGANSPFNTGATNNLVVPCWTGHPGLLKKIKRLEGGEKCDVCDNALVLANQAGNSFERDWHFYIQHARVEGFCVMAVQRTGC